jgi:hypothetical protein
MKPEHYLRHPEGRGTRVSKKPWDYYKQLAVVPGHRAFFTAEESGCTLTK